MARIVEKNDPIKALGEFKPGDIVRSRDSRREYVVCSRHIELPGYVTVGDDRTPLLCISNSQIDWNFNSSRLYKFVGRLEE